MYRLLIIGLLAGLLAGCSNDAGLVATAIPPTPQPTADAPTVPPAPDFTPPEAFDEASAPDTLLGSLYNAINRGDFARAYSYFEAPEIDEAEFTAGYATTSASAVLIDPNFRIDTGAGNQHAAVRSVIVAYDSSAGWQLFAGCYILHRVNINGPSEPWYVQRASIDPVEAVGALGERLAELCADQPSAATKADAYADASSDTALLTSLGNAINRGEFERGADYFDPSIDPASLGQRYPQKATVYLLVNPDARAEGAAGSVYRALPLVQSVKDVVGQPTLQAGCVILHRPNIEPDLPWDVQSLTAEPLGLEMAGLFAAATRNCAP